MYWMKYLCIQLGPSPHLRQYLTQLYEWRRLPRVLCGLAGIHYQVPQGIFCAGETRQVKHNILYVLINIYLRLLYACSTVQPFSLFTCLRCWSRLVCHAPRCVQLLPGDWAAFGPSISLHRAAHLHKWSWERELCR